MKRFILWIALLTSQMAMAQGWEWLNPLPQGNALMGLVSLGEDRVLSVAYNGVAIASTDGGQEWSLFNAGGRVFPTAMKFVSPSEGWGIVGSYSSSADSVRNSIVHTTDGGLSWLLSYHNPEVLLDGIAFPTSRSGWVVGHLDSTSRMVVLRTSDGGGTWTEQVGDSNGSGGKIFFLNDQEGWISIYQWTLHTTDGGNTWQWFSAPNWFYFDFFMVDSQNGWESGFDDVYRTTDAGQTWTPTNFPLSDNEYPYSIALADPNHVWVVTTANNVSIGRNHIVTSTNGGQTWSRRDAGTKVDLHKVVFADAQRGWICGDNGIVLQTANGGTTWSVRCGNPLTEELAYEAMDFADLQNGWVVTWSRTRYAPILHTVDGGVHWNVQYADTNQAFTDVVALSPTNVWAVGTIVLHTTDGGLEWNAVEVGSRGSFWSIVCLNEQVIWIYSEGEDGQQVHRSTNGGATWATHDVPLGNKFAGMAAGDRDNVWVAGWSDRLDEGTVVHSSNGGRSWVTQGDSLGYFGAMFFLDAASGWANTWLGLVHTTDGGDHWSIEDQVPNFNPARIEFLDEQNGWMMGDGGAYRTEDGGETWQRFDPYTDLRLSDIAVVDRDHAWVSGWSGTVLRFDGTSFAAPEPSSSVASSFALLPAYPNPFNPSTTISYILPQAGHISLRIFDLLGREVAVLKDGFVEAGTQRVAFDGSSLSSGIYFARLEAGKSKQTTKLVLLK